MNAINAISIIGNMTMPIIEAITMNTTPKNAIQHHHKNASNTDTKSPLLRL